MTVHKLKHNLNIVCLRLIFLFTAGLLLFTTPVSASADEFSTEEPSAEDLRISHEDSGYSMILYDEADFFDEQEEQLLTSQMKEIMQYCNVSVVTTTEGSSSYSSTEDYAVACYEDWFSPGANGVIFVIDRCKDQIYLCSEGSSRKIITNGRASTITDNTYVYATSSHGYDYYTCASKTLEQVNTLMQGGRIAQPMRYICSALLSLILALLVNYFIVMFKSRSRRANIDQILEGAYSSVNVHNAHAAFVNQTRVYSPPSESSGGGSSGGGGGGGGGHSGGGHSI